MIKNLTDATKALRKRFPRFKKFAGNDDRMSYDNDFPYLLFGDFASFLGGKLEKLGRQELQRDDCDLRDGFLLIGELIESTRPDILELVEVGILENISSHPLATEIAEQYLDPNTFRIFKTLIGKIV